MIRFGSLWLVVSGWIGLSLLINLLKPNWWLLTIAFPFDVVLVGSLLVAAIVLLYHAKKKLLSDRFLLGYLCCLVACKSHGILSHWGSIVDDRRTFDTARCRVSYFSLVDPSSDEKAISKARNKCVACF